MQIGSQTRYVFRLRRPHITAVYIASPNGLHYQQAKGMISAGKLVILGKSATSTADEYEALFTLARANGVFVVEVYRHLQEHNFKILEQSVRKLG